jgi:hypothetical protein
MNKILALLPLILLLSNCPKQNKDKNELLLEAYTGGDYVKCLEILKDGADGRIDLNPSTPDCPVLFDICLNYLDSESRMPEIEELFNFYLKNRKEAFEDSIKGVHPAQTVGSYLARFAPVELLRQIAREKININSPDECKLDEYGISTAIFELAGINMRSPISSRYFYDLTVNIEEKKIRMELLLDAGAYVNLTADDFGRTIFDYFSWYPMEEDFAGLLDRMIEKGADLFNKTRNGYSCIRMMLNPFALQQNAEAYLEYAISRGLEVTEDDLDVFYRFWSRYMDSDNATDADLRRLERIKTILDNNVK